MVVSFVYLSWMSGSSDWRFWIIFLCMAPKKKAYSKCLSVVSGDTAKTVERVTSGVAWLGMTVGGHPTVEHTVAFCELMRVLVKILACASWLNRILLLIWRNMSTSKRELVMLCVCAH